MPRGDTLWKRLESARPVELLTLAEMVGVPEARQKASAVLVEEISRNLRAAAGHAVVNLFRNSHDLPYKRMLIDVADKLTPGWTIFASSGYKLNDNHSEIEVEEAIWRLFEKRLDPGLAGGAGGQESLRGWMSQEVPGQPLHARVWSVLLPLLPSSIANNLVGNTAYRTTIPAVLYLIQIRKLREAEATLG